VTSGATEALAAAFFAVLEPGDEVIVFDPAYDAYRPLIARAGGVAVSIALVPPLWRIEAAALEATITPRTRAIVLNDPMNPAARAFSDAERAILAQACVRHDLIAICDEVWEHVLFDGRAHRSLLSFPGMQERAIKIGSAGKMFSMTGWKVGFLLAGPLLIEPLAKAHQFLTFTTPPSLQAAAAEGLDWPAERFEVMRSEFQRGRDRLTQGLRAAGFSVLDSDGTYFACVDLPASGVTLGARDFCLRAVAEHGVAAIPLEPFFADPSMAPAMIRLCFAKSDETLDAGVARLTAARRTFQCEGRSGSPA
jgi:N-succinyldiaminopimelate aminotransferase